ncbi:hypothetical protein MHC_03485 [Mycoplasma haemocanis str. Illinois]|uniref:Uncharacterized protein n=1 Tax=Mycoplasma haemocanis (strain Illinois) TaxID=1111676 RepID=H6N7D5_MYCHN|nr:hypothetical protein [Mycoplasma haemocanis]AEW45557.1 hypothetical protein MHC_03485 [Mycoplasma haemocanis str. Illinois]
MLGGFTKLLFGGSLLAGTCVSLGISALTPKQLKNTALITEGESGYTEFNLTNSSETETGVSQPQTPETQSQTSVSSGGESSTTATTSTTSEASRQPEQEKSCTIHQLESSSGRTWNISKIGTWEEFSKRKAKSGEHINSQVIKKKCDASKGKDILVVNLPWQWLWRRWDYSDKEQNHQQFKDYLEKQKKH